VEVEKRIQAHRQNLKSLCLFDHVIATASQDKSLALWDKHTLEPINVKKNAHKKAFGLVGAWNEYILSVSFACGEIKVWDCATLREKVVIPIAPCLSGQTCLHQAHLYLSSRAINGIDCVDIETIVR
jgi:WD40 repeat protein